MHILVNIAMIPCFPQVFYHLGTAVKILKNYISQYFWTLVDKDTKVEIIKNVSWYVGSVKPIFPKMRLRKSY